MKITILTVTCLVSCMGGASAQTAEQQTKPFPPIEKQELNLKYLGSDSSSILNRIYKDGEPSRYLQKEEANAYPRKTENLKSEMPILLPDSSIKFPILAVVPDSSIHLHILVSTPD